MSAQLNWAVLWPLCPYLELRGPIWTQIRSFPHIEYYKTLSFSQFISSLLFWNVDPCRPNYSNQSRNIRRKYLISEISCPCQSSQQGPWWSAEGIGKKCFIISFPVVWLFKEIICYLTERWLWVRKHWNPCPVGWRVGEFVATLQKSFANCETNKERDSRALGK